MVPVALEIDFESLWITQKQAIGRMYVYVRQFKPLFASEILPISSDFVNIYFSAHPSTLPPSILQFVLHASTTLFLRCDPISKGFWKFEGMNTFIRTRRKMTEFLKGECFSISNWIRMELALMEGSTLDLWWFYFHITEGERVRFWGEAKTLSAYFVLEYRV